jgi:hypothetical protein
MRAFNVDFDALQARTIELHIGESASREEAF